MVDLWDQAGPGGPGNPFKKWGASHTPQPFWLKLCAELVAVLVCFLACDGKARSMGDDPDFMRCFAACSKPDPRCFSACGGPAAELRGQLALVSFNFGIMQTMLDSTKQWTTHAKSLVSLLLKLGGGADIISGCELGGHRQVSKNIPTLTEQYSQEKDQTSEAVEGFVWALS